jgi:phytoene/squalene synthetase
MSKHEPTRLDFASEIDFGAILTNPILDIAARLWESDRYEAFKVCYRSMRRVDDLVDDLKSGHGEVPSVLAIRARSEIDRWLESVRGHSADDEFGRLFLATLERFAIPLWPWERLGKAMTYDLYHGGFSTFRVFLRYAEGAAISPAAVFMHLCGIHRDHDRYGAPPYDIRRAARPLAIFSYLVHIIRDFEKDQRAGLDYFADDLIERFGLSRQDLRKCALTGTADDRLRSLMCEYHRIAAHYQVWARQTVDTTLPYLDDRYQLSLELIYMLYSQIFERFNPKEGAFTATALNPPPEAIRRQVELTISQFRPVPKVTVIGNRTRR